MSLLAMAVGIKQKEIVNNVIQKVLYLSFSLNKIFSLFMLMKLY